MPARIVFRAHALQRMSERGIMPEDIIMILWTGETIKRYPDDTPYEPDQARWSADFRRRKS